MRRWQPRFVSSLAALVVPVLFIPPAPGAIGTFHRTLHVSGPILLRVHTASGYIHVRPGPAGEVHIVGHIHAAGVAYGQAAADRVQRVLGHPPIQQDARIITIGRHLKGTSNVVINYDITAPRGSQLEATTGSGNLRLSGLDGPLRAFTGSGNIQATDFTGHVWLRCGSGGIHADLEGANDVMARTGSGAIRIRGINGPLLADAGSGDIHVAGRPAGDWLVHTGYGEVALNVGHAPFVLEATTGSGWIYSKAAISTHCILERHHITGKGNGGGPTVRVETGYGDIRIH
ncbi:MAG TPA: DUF4097 family beta strand repeat-containing protein [Acidobacteriaceae bacterium]|nr:DUF4097 family beta strand repeat-containing protein [Acidobacteriaceae bacterium]